MTLLLDDVAASSSNYIISIYPNHIGEGPAWLLDRPCAYIWALFKLPLYTYVYFPLHLLWVQNRFIMLYPSVLARHINLHLNLAHRLQASNG